MVVELKKSDNSLSGPYNRFIYALKAPESQRQYPKRLEVYLNFIDIGGLNIQEKLYNLFHKAKFDTQWLQDSLINFIIFQKERVSRGEITDSTIPNYYKPIKLFCDMNDISVNWKLITRGMPRGNHAANDRAPTVEEIKKLLEYPDRRIKSIVLIMISSGIRIGAFDYLKSKHIIPLKDDEDGKIIAAKMIVYAGEPEQYVTFISPEAYSSWIEWMDYRASYGEKITHDSWAMRDLWKTTNITYGAKLGYAKTPVKLKSSGIRSLLSKALFQQNVRPVLEKGIKRHEFKTAHGFRKFFKTQAEQSMLAANVELLLGHDLGVSSCYYKPLEKDLLADYLRAIPSLTIIKNTSELIAKQIENERVKMKEEQNHAFNQLRAEFDSKIQQLFLKIDAGKI